MGITPAAGQILSGGETQFDLGEVLRILELLPAMDPARHNRGEGIGQLAQIKDLHQGMLMAGIVAVLVQGEKHRIGLPCGQAMTVPSTVGAHR